jgi:hypothetical protein
MTGHCCRIKRAAWVASYRYGRLRQGTKRLIWGSPPPMNRGALTHDDRLDAVAGAVARFQRAMMMDVDQAAKAMRDEEMLAEIEDFIEGFNQPTYRGMRINGQRVATWSSQHGWSGDSRPDAEWIRH